MLTELGASGHRDHRLPQNLLMPTLHEEVNEYTDLRQGERTPCHDPEGRVTETVKRRPTLALLWLSEAVTSWPAVMLVARTATGCKIRSSQPRRIGSLWPLVADEPGRTARVDISSVARLLVGEHSLEAWMGSSAASGG